MHHTTVKLKSTIIIQVLSSRKLSEKRITEVMLELEQRMNLDLSHIKVTDPKATLFPRFHFDGSSLNVEVNE